MKQETDVLNGLIKIRKIGNLIQVNTECFVVTWDGVKTSNIYVPKRFGNSLTGICGNCNDRIDDSLIDAQGVNHNKPGAKKREKDRSFANTYLVPGQQG